MKIAVISDIHSNAFALREVLREVDRYEADELWILGDIFGYYPWAAEVWELLQPYLHKTIAIKGNHDLLLERTEPPQPEPSYWQAACANKAQLPKEALTWLAALSLRYDFERGDQRISLVHGHPTDEENGRFYPDHQGEESWFPLNKSWLFLGHTHYPLVRETTSHGLIVNPGSVGQPRDGDPRSAWAAVDLASRKVDIHRVAYNVEEVQQLLVAMAWEERAIRALNKTHKGAL